MANKPFVFRFHDVEVREREFTLTKAGKVLAVEPKAFRALLFLLRNSQKVVSKEELLNSVWGDTAVTEGSLTRCIWLLRRVLGDDINEPRYIATIATVGYRFIAKVEVSEDASGDPAAPREPEAQGAVGNEIEQRKRSVAWALASAGVLTLCLTATIWFLHRPLPPPRISKYAQITHDGHKKKLAGTDGTRIYFNQMSGGILPESIAEVAVSGGGIAQVPVAVPSPEVVDVSPDGSNLLVISVPEGDQPAGSLWNVRTLGGQARRLGETGDAAFSPDGNSVAYSTPEGHIRLVRNDGTGAHNLASLGEAAWAIAWSPDGSVIRFNKGDAIWEMTSNGSNPHKLPLGNEPSGVYCCGRWTPDGEFFLFRVQPSGVWEEGSEIWVLDERRGLFRRPPAEPIQLTGGPMRWGIPIPAKDGKRIFAKGVIPKGELSRYDKQNKQFQPFLGGVSAQGAVFSKDGQSVAYISFPEAILWKANRDGSNPIQLSEPSMWAFLPRWSPDGTQIAFRGWTPTTQERIYVVSATGDSAPKNLVEISDPQDFPFWSPDGHKIAFSVTRVHTDSKSDIRVLDLDTRQVTTVSGSDGLFAPRWSPDGKYLAAGTDDELHLKIFDFKTHQWSELAPKGNVESWEWSKDSRYLYFRRVKGDPGLFRVSVKGGGVEKICDLKGWHDAGWFGEYMGLDPTDAPLLLRDVGSEDIYALTLEEK